jgi:hypothetical protein
MERTATVQAGLFELGVARGADDEFGEDALSTAGTHVGLFNALQQGFFFQ